MKLRRLLAFLLALGGTFFLSEFVLRFFGYSLLKVGHIQPYTPSYIPFGSWMRGTLKEGGFLCLLAFTVYFEQKLPKPIANRIIFLGLFIIGYGIFYGTELIRLSNPYLNPEFRSSTTLIILFWLAVTTIVWGLSLKKVKTVSGQNK